MRDPSMSQLSLFAPDGPDNGARASARHSAALEAARPDLIRLAERLPPGIRFGTSSWSFPGWAGLVYPATATTTELSHSGLTEYARHPLLRTVGIDRSYYGPIPADDWRRYACQLPEGFPCCAKAPAVVTSAVMPDDRGRHTARPNPDFLSADRLMDELLEPCARWFADHTGPFIIECPPVPAGCRLAPERFEDRLDAFLERLPTQFEYAMEIRDRRYLTPGYRRILESRGVGHVYTYWRDMPVLDVQADVLPPETQPFAVVRLLMPPGTTYEALRNRYRPFDRIVQADDGLRRQVVRLVRRAARRGRRSYVLVNNKAEGSAPLTIRALAERLVDDEDA